MTIPASTASLAFALSQIQQFAQQAKSQAQGYLTTLQSSSVDSSWVFNLLDKLGQVVSTLNGWSTVAGLNTFATANIPGYSGTLTTDMASAVTAAQNCTAWIVANFPKDSTNTYILAFVLNSDGTRTPRQFTPAQTAGLQTALQSFIATIN